MIRPFRTLGFLGALSVAGGVGMGCQPSNDVSAGAPRLLSFSVLGPDGAVVALDDGDGGTLPAPPRGTFSALFDRLLDPTTLEVIEPDGGGLTGQAGVATIVSTPVIDPAGVVETYIPNGIAPGESGPQLPDGGGPALVPVYSPGPRFVVMPTLAMPCATTVSITLQPTKLRSHDRQLPFQPANDAVKSALTFVTEPFMVTITVPHMAVDGADGGPATDDAGVPVDPIVHVRFNTLLTRDVADQIHVTVTQAGVVVPGLGMPAQDAADPALWNIPPPDSGWPSGAVVTIEVDADIVDNYGTTLGAPVSASFTAMVTP